MNWLEGSEAFVVNENAPEGTALLGGPNLNFSPQLVLEVPPKPSQLEEVRFLELNDENKLLALNEEVCPPHLAAGDNIGGPGDELFHHSNYNASERGPSTWLGMSREATKWRSLGFASYPLCAKKSLVRAMSRQGTSGNLAFTSSGTLLASSPMTMSLKATASWRIWSWENSSRGTEEYSATLLAEAMRSSRTSTPNFKGGGNAV